MSVLLTILAVIVGFWAFGFLLNALAVLVDHYDGFLGLLPAECLGCLGGPL